MTEAECPLCQVELRIHNERTSAQGRLPRRQVVRVHRPTTVLQRQELVLNFWFGRDHK